MISNTDKYDEIENIRLNILLVEDSPTDALLVRTHIEKLKNYSIETVEQLSEAVDKIQKSNFNIVLLDLCLPDALGLEGLVTIRRLSPNLAIVVLTGLNDERTAIMALQRGAQDYLVKGKENNRIVQAIRYAIERMRLMSPDRVPADWQSGLNDFKNTAVLPKSSMEDDEKFKSHKILTERELQILKLLGKGCSNQEMADLLSISITTIKSHISSILQKLQVTDRTKAVVEALRCGLI